MRREGESREAQAAREVGHTDVSPGVAISLTATFIVLLLGVAALEIERGVAKGDSPWAELKAAPGRAWPLALGSDPLAANRQLLASMVAFEDALEDGSVVTERVLPQVQLLLTERLEVGNEQVVTGRRGWLYFRPALDYLTGPGFLDPARLGRAAEAGEAWEPRRRPNPLPAIADFGAQLAERGVSLVLVVTPIKAALHPEGLKPALADADLPLENPSFARFLERLAEMEIPVYVPGQRLAETLRERSWPQFLRGDTHWTTHAMENAAEGLASFLAQQVPLPSRNPVVYSRHEAWVEARGDLVSLLKLPPGKELFPVEPARTRPVVGRGGEPWSPDPNADVLVLGDSFTNVYSQAELGWGQGAGFAEQISYYLRRPVDKLAVNAGGPSAARERLAQELGAGVDRLAGKRLVIYQFSARELMSGDWKLVDLSPAPGRPAKMRHRPEQGVPARGLVAWESNRGRDWRIWTRRLEGSPPRQLSPDEPDRQHCCAHISPGGTQIAYLSRSVPRDSYPELEVPGELRILRLSDGSARTLAGDARPYGWGNRAVVWRNEKELIYIGGDGRTYLLDVGTGRASALTDEPRRKLAWLVDATLRHAVSGSPAFSAYDADAGRVIEGERLPGCEPYFTHDGRFGFWVSGGGGPIRWIDLESRDTGILLQKNDPRIPGDQRYVYFPMVSRDNRMLAFGASPGDHDHALSNYDIFVAPIDPASLALTGRPMRLTAHPAGDRYPDVHVDGLDRERWRQQAPPEPLDRSGAAQPAIASGQPFRVRATLQACSRVPSLREISPYRAALIVCEWEVVQVLAGEPPSTRLRIAHWALLDGARQPIASLAPGEAVRLRTRPLAGVEIEGYPVFDTLPPAPDRPVYFSDEP